NDQNGYPNDISGWNFHRDTNDPQTDNTIYHHANGESETLAATANNKFGGAGLCPGCRLLSVKMGDEAIDRPDRVAEGIVFAVNAGAKVIDVTTAALGQTPSMLGAVEYAHRHGAGVAALVSSAGEDAAAEHKISEPLSANEVFQMTRSTVGRIEETPCTNCFPGLAGAEWNIQYGYGRPNVYKAMKAVHEGTIPPEA